MLVYKFRTFSNLDRVKSILSDGELYCAEYETLNDPFEGIFHLLFESRGGGVATSVASSVARGIARSVTGGGSYTYKKAKSIKEVFAHDNNKCVCSFSSEPTDPRLWAHYASNCTGMAIGVDFSDNIEDLKAVVYHDSLQQFNAGKIASMSAKEVLSFKTKHWEYETEFRVIQSSSIYNAKGRIKSVLLGPRVQNEHREFVLNVAPKNAQVFETELDFSKVRIKTKTELSRT